MLKRSGETAPERAIAAVSEPREFITGSDIRRFLRRFRVSILGTIALCMGLAWLQAATTPKSYTGRAQLLLDSASASATAAPERQGGSEMAALDSPGVEGQLALLRSESIARAVVEKLKLADDPAFMGGGPGLIGRIVGGLKGLILGSSSELPLRSDLERAALESFIYRLEVRRVGLSYAIDITFTAGDPSEAARLANAVARQYIDDQIATASRAARQSSDWLEARLNQLRSQLNTAARQLQVAKSGRDNRLIGGASERPAGGLGLSPGITLPAPASTDVGVVPTVPSVVQVGPSGAAAAAAAEAPRPARVDPASIEELESSALTFRKMYESYYRAFTAAVQRQSLPSTNARIITEATPPRDPSAPKTKLMIAFGGLLGLLGGLGLAFLRYNTDGSVRSSRLLRLRTGLECIAQVPRLGGSGATVAGSRSLSALKAAASVAAARNVPSAASDAATLRAVLEVPFSQFAGAIKIVRSSVVNAEGAPVRCLGLLSCLPREGKSTIAGNLAALFGASGTRTLIIDADLHNRTLTQALTSGDTGASIITALAQPAQLATHVVPGAMKGVDLLTAQPSEAISYNEMGGDAMRALLAAASESYDMVIVDLPPINPVVDVLAVSTLLDGVVLVAEWGVTPLELLQDAGNALAIAQARVLGVVVTKVDEAEISGMRWKRALSYGY